MNKEIASHLTSVYNKRFCRIAVGQHNSLSVGFGEEELNDIERGYEYYCEWEMGTYYCSWRIIKDGKVILGSNDSRDIEYMNEQVGKIELGCVVEICNTTRLDVQVLFEDGMIIEFINTISEEDEVFHLFCPQDRYIQFTTEGLWDIGPSNAPWIDGSL